MNIPSTYLDINGDPPPKLDPDALAMLALARGVWARLPTAMQRALVDGWRVTGRPCGCHPNVRKPTLDALRRRGLCESYGVYGGVYGVRGWLSNLGLIVREAGTRIPKATP